LAKARDGAQVIPLSEGRVTTLLEVLHLQMGG
jgi:hypothetical protein